MKQLFHLLMPYLNKKYWPGAGIRWIISDRIGLGKRAGKGRAIDCLFCGNFANGVGHIHFMKNDFYIPICKSHSGQYMDRHSNGEPWELTFPTIIKMNIKSNLVG